MCSGSRGGDGGWAWLLGLRRSRRLACEGHVSATNDARQGSDVLLRRALAPSWWRLPSEGDRACANAAGFDLRGGDKEPVGKSGDSELIQPTHRVCVVESLLPSLEGQFSFLTAFACSFFCPSWILTTTFPSRGRAERVAARERLAAHGAAGCCGHETAGGRVPAQVRGACAHARACLRVRVYARTRAIFTFSLGQTSCRLVHVEC